MSQASQHAYYLLRAAQHHFQRPPDQLSPEQSQWLEPRVLNQQQLESRILSSPEAAAVQVPDQQLSRALAEIQGQYESGEAFEAALQRLDLSIPILSGLLRRQLRVEQLLEQQGSRLEEASEEDARRYYASHQQQFIKPERRQAWHLLLTLNADYPENRRAAVFKRLGKIRTEIKGDLQRFQQQAERHSECPSALKGGELGWIPRGHLYPELDRALFALSAGEVSELIETELGLHLLLCSQIEAEQPLPFEAVVETLRLKLSDAQRRRAQQQWLRSLR